MKRRTKTILIDENMFDILNIYRRKYYLKSNVEASKSLAEMIKKLELLKK